jgi:hypothetical protein
LLIWLLVFDHLIFLGGWLFLDISLKASFALLSFVCILSTVESWNNGYSDRRHMWYTYIRFLGIAFFCLCDVNVILCEYCTSGSIYMRFARSEYEWIYYMLDWFVCKV